MASHKKSIIYSKATCLVHRAEDVCVVLLETSDSGQARKSSRQLVTVQDPKISQTQRQFPPRARPVVKHQTGK